MKLNFEKSFRPFFHRRRNLRNSYIEYTLSQCINSQTSIYETGGYYIRSNKRKFVKRFNNI